MRCFALLLALGTVTVGCGESTDGSPAATTGSDPEAAWLDLVASMGLDPAQGFVEVLVSGGGAKLSVVVMLSPDAPEEVFFADGLYGATAYTFRDENWARVDTAEVRTEIAPLLHQGDKAQFSLPVHKADSYRVLVPVNGKASWGDR